MCDKWLHKYYNNNLSCEGIVINSGEGEYTVKGKVNSKTINPTVLFWAAAPPLKTASYTGSGIPYANPNMAFENTPNKGAVVAKNREFSFKIRFPNSYYTRLGTVYNKPHVTIKVCEPNCSGKVQKIELGDGIPFRMLTWPKLRSSCLFYKSLQTLPVRSQEQILRDSAYPKKNKMPKNFWGLTPPV